MQTTHKIFFENSTQMKTIPSSSVDLIVTSPPYPMIEMWDEMFCQQNPSIQLALKQKDGIKAFKLMHDCLNPVWEEIYRVLKEGGIACINIGDATRTVNSNFCLYSNHSMIINHLRKIGFNTLPNILWRKQTNAPNKFMGSGMLPAGAYVTLEHEYILIVRKGHKREFKSTDEKRKRRESAFFWEERNIWFSDIWMDIKGTTQEIKNNHSRGRSAAYPFEIAYRLINMYSVKGDVILDPFLGTGTTTAAAIASCRNSVGFEIDKNLLPIIKNIENNIVEFSNELIKTRIYEHINFVRNRLQTKGPFKHNNIYYGFPVITAQEKELLINEVKEIKNLKNNDYEVIYSEEPQSIFCKDWSAELETTMKHFFANNYQINIKQKSYEKKDFDNQQKTLF